MRRIILIRLLLLLMISAALAWGGRMVVSAGSGPYNLSWHSVDGGGGVSINNGYAVQGSIGQPDADQPEPSAAQRARSTAHGEERPLGGSLNDNVYI